MLMIVLKLMANRRLKWLKMAFEFKNDRRNIKSSFIINVDFESIFYHKIMESKT